MKNFIIIQIARYTPFLSVKNWLYRTFLKMNVGKQTSFALMVMPDIMFPEKITVGKNSIIGYNTTILAHEYLIHEYRIGFVTIGDEVMIGANTTILPGVTIGSGAVVSAKHAGAQRCPRRGVCRRKSDAGDLYGRRNEKTNGKPRRLTSAGFFYDLITMAWLPICFQAFSKSDLGLFFCFYSRKDH